MKALWTLMIGLAAATAASSQVPQGAERCTAPEHRRMDYMLGEWRIVDSVTGGDFAHNRVERVHDGCALRENLQLPNGAVGSSLIFYSPLDRLWHLVFHDSNSFFAHVTGFTDSHGRQELTGDLRFIEQPRRINKARQLTYRDEAGRPRQIGHVMDENDLSWRLIYDITFCRAELPPAEQRPPCAIMAGERAEFRSDRISVETRGSGPDVILIPGMSSHPRVWESTIAAIPGYRYHLVHVAGFAGSAARANASGPVLEPVAAEIARYVEESGLDRPALVGHSMGGTWAMMVVARRPDLVSRVMVVDMVPFMGALLGAPTAEAVRSTADRFRETYAAQTEAEWRRAIEHTIAGQVRTESLRPVLVEHALTSDRTTSIQALYEGLTFDLRPELGRMSTPLTILYVTPPNGPLSPERIEQVFRQSYAAARRAVFRRIPDSYHFIMIDQPELFRQELRDFLRAD